jgi:hypothetical protein
MNKQTEISESEKPKAAINLIRSELKAPKKNRNDFGKYDYRSCEDILEAVKPILLKYDVLLSIQDSIDIALDRIYLKSVAQLWDNSGKMISESTGFAREPDQKKGMSSDQVTGSASSYARKYALNALFLIDDSSEPDSVEDQVEPITQDQADEIHRLLDETGTDKAKVLHFAGVSKAEDIPANKLGQIMRKLQAGKGCAK